MEKKLHKYEIYMEPFVKDMLKKISIEEDKQTSKMISQLIIDRYLKNNPQDKG